ncbi:hypothetical protein FSP39_013000 [Pinctada imbricata]|uniref:Uncharacterized protein n=1 Tax=Pinctada imbricata TaxID=66713 RepID=A0AA88YG80_PINIB|nr:hypothetical protein FSP39_013000 [Pinctada imbricata]
MENVRNLSSKPVPIPITAENLAKYLLQANRTSTIASTVTPASDAYDDAGAMQYVVAVILIYSSAVIGVFILGFFSRRQKQNVQIDEQANYFLKDIRDVRMTIERKQRLEKIRSFSRSISLDPSLLSRTGETVKSGVLSMGGQMASLAINDTDSKVSSATGTVPNNNVVTGGDSDFSLKEKCRQHLEIEITDSDGKCLSNEKLCVPLLENNVNEKIYDNSEETGIGGAKTDFSSRRSENGDFYTSRTNEKLHDGQLNVPLLGNGAVIKDKIQT